MRRYSPADREHASLPGDLEQHSGNGGGIGHARVLARGRTRGSLERDEAFETVKRLGQKHNFKGGRRCLY